MTLSPSFPSPHPVRAVLCSVSSSAAWTSRVPSRPRLLVAADSVWPASSFFWREPEYPPAAGQVERERCPEPPCCSSFHQPRKIAFPCEAGFGFTVRGECGGLPKGRCPPLGCWTGSQCSRDGLPAFMWNTCAPTVCDSLLPS